MAELWKRPRWGIPSAKLVEDAGTALGIKTADAADMLRLANGGILQFLQRATGADAVVGTAAGVASGSTDWAITSIKLHMDTLYVDEALVSSYTSRLLKGSSLAVPYRSYTPISSTHAGPSTAMLQIPRELSVVWSRSGSCHRSQALVPRKMNFSPASGARTR